MGEKASSTQMWMLVLSLAKDLDSSCPRTFDMSRPLVKVFRYFIRSCPGFSLVW